MKRLREVRVAAAMAVATVAMAMMLTGCCAMCPWRQEARVDKLCSQELVRTTQSWDGAALPAYPAGKPEIRVLRIAIPAGARLPLHHHPVINVGYLTKGQLTVHAEGGQVLTLKAGDPIVELVNTPHYGVNDGDTPAEIVVVYVTSEGQDITVYDK
ncbi:MAG: cupin domain-containing protein [Lentisphaerae bacterium]|nr:cupin domain-containing protein [Lentisphaerota bacterium]